MLTILKKLLINGSLLIGFVLMIDSKTSPIYLEKKSWPAMQHFDIWGTKLVDAVQESQLVHNKSVQSEIVNNSGTTGLKMVTKIADADDHRHQNVISADSNYVNLNRNRQSKVLSFFPVPVEEECLANDGRRFGTCLNVYECRKKGGQGKGECALGFGVCCIFVASCDQEIFMNNTYLVSPNFPSFMKNNLTECKVKIKMMASDISQLRIDFHHMLLGQPNRRTGICDGDVFEVTGGPAGPFKICGQNSGQHVYYDVDGMSSRQTPQMPTVAKPPSSEDEITDSPIELDNLNNDEDDSEQVTETLPMVDETMEIAIKFASRVIQTRFWEIRVMQIPFSQRAPAGCLQFYNSPEGIIQTFNFAENGRHLANQNYRSCIRQERGMCSIVYEPCDDNSFRIGPTTTETPLGDTPLNQDTITSPLSLATQSPSVQSFTSQPSTAIPIQSDDNQQVPSETQPVVAEDDVAEGSGGNDDIPAAAAIITESPPAPVRGGFDILSFFRSAFYSDVDDDDENRSVRRHQRQLSNIPNFFTQCSDRITMPCIVEDFIADGGVSRFPGCEPVHCGMQFCSTSNSGTCRIESTVTPFYLGVHFGDGIGKGSPEENIGSCLKYTQMPCI